MGAEKSGSVSVRPKLLHPGEITLRQEMSDTKEYIRTTCPRDCYDACGIMVSTRGGEVVKVAGDRTHPISRGTLCGKCAVAYNGIWRSPEKRLLHPLLRNGRKGSGTFVPCSWKVALVEIAEQLSRVLRTSGPGSIYHTHYTGTCSLLAGNFGLRFFNRLGAVEVDPDTVCNKAGHMALQLVFGDSLLGFDPRTEKDSKCILVWGANPSSAAPHADRHWLKTSKAFRLVIDPIRHATAAAADLHLQPRPGSDAALAFSLLHVLRRENMFDRTFLDAHVLGWDAVEAQLDMTTPAWGEAQTSVPADKIIAAATAFGSGPSLLWLGQGLQRQPTGGNVFRACSLLPIATGNIGKSGGGFLYMNGFAGRGIDIAEITRPQLNRAGTGTVSHMDLAAILEDPARSQALFTWNNNIAASSPQQRRLKAALEREDLFHVAIDLFATDTVDCADVVLPAASFLEFDDLVLSYFNLTVSAQCKTMEPLGEALPNQEIFRRLAKAMGFDEPELFEPDRAILERLLQRTGVGLDFAALAQVGTVDWSTEPVVQFADRVFPTPSGKIEVAGARFVAVGLPSAPQPAADPPPPSGFLRVLSPANVWLMNSSYHLESHIRRQMGPQRAFLNPIDAAERGLKDGDPIRLQNATGSLDVITGIDAGVPRMTILLHKGRWPKLEQHGHNVNVLNPGAKTDLGESSSVHAIEVTVTPIKIGSPTPDIGTAEMARP
jgi:anaerobic selenocysteine-containing dehydrogenase